MQICPVCGHENTELAIFCSNPTCRTLLRWDQPTTPEKPVEVREKAPVEAGGSSPAGEPGGLTQPPGVSEGDSVLAPPGGGTDGSPDGAEGGEAWRPAEEASEEEPAQAPSTPTFAAVRPGAPPRRAEGPSGEGGAETPEEDEESIRSERARFLAVRPGARSAPPQRPGVEIQRVGVTLSLSPTEAAIEPGGEATFEVLVRNTGTIVDQFAIQVSGDAARWASVDPPSVNLYPASDAAVVTLRFSPPHSPYTPAGPARFEVRAVSAENSNISAAAQGVLNVAPFYALSAGLIPHTSEGRRRADHRFTLSNQGNTRVNATLTPGDPDSRLRFTLSPSAVTADPGNEVASEVRVRPRKAHWLGAPVLRPFDVTASAEAAPPVRAEGQFQHISLIPKWVPPAAIVALPLVVLLVSFLTRTAKLPNVFNEQGAVAADELKAAGFQPVNGEAVPSGDVAQGRVVRTEPAASSRRVRKGPVTVILSKGLPIPNVVGQDVAGATQQLQAAGLTVAKPLSESNQAGAGKVIATDPPANALVSTGSPVTLRVSSGVATLVANPTSVTMPGLPVGSSGEPQTVTISNQGTGDLAVTAVAIGGTNAADFTVTSNTCAGTVVVPGGNCPILVSFTPGGAGARTATLSISSNASGGSPSVTLMGTGLTSETGLSAASLNFETQKVGTPSAAQTVTVTNKGSAPMTVRDATVTGGNPDDFTVTDGCKGTTVTPGSACSLGVVFNPKGKGARSGRLAVANTAGAAQNVTLVGKGTVPEATITPLSLILANGEPNNTKVVTVTNTGDAPLSLRTPTIRGSEKIRIDSDCRNDLAPNASCKVTVMSVDQLLGKCETALLTIQTDDPAKNEVQVPMAAGPTGTKLLPGNDLLCA